MESTKWILTGPCGSGVAARRRISAFSRWADLLFGRTTVRNKRQTNITLPTYASDVLAQSESERLERRRHLVEKLRRKRAVFFGDGSFSSCARGSCPIAKKAFLKLSSARGVTVYNDEFNTSKMCPCGTDELITITGSDKCSRIPQPKAAVRIPFGIPRCHKTLSTECTCPLGRFNGDRFDIDELATYNMLHCAQNALRGLDRPSFLCRSTHVPNWDSSNN